MTRVSSVITTRAFTLALLWLLFALLLLGARQLSFTYDEPSHLAAGYAYLARGQAGLWTVPLRGHPLLVNVWEALPLYIGNPQLPVETLDGWGTDRRAYAEAFIHAIGPLENSEMSGRVPAALLTLLLAAVIFRWVKDLWDIRAGIVALLLLTFDPTLLAHGRLATNDVGVTALGTLYLYLTWRWIRAPSWKTAVLTGTLAGLTVLAKGSGVLWTAAGGIAMVWRMVGEWRIENRKLANRRMTNDELRITDHEPTHTPRPATHDHPSFKISSLLMQTLITVGIAFLLVWAMYGFTAGPLSETLPVPVPAPLHWQGILLQTGDAGEREFFALGQTWVGRRWWYFPLTFLMKNPLPFLIGIVFSLGGVLYQFRAAGRKVRPVGRAGKSVLLLFPIFYTLVAITLGPNIGYRHMLPVHPFLYLLMSHITHHAPRITYHASRLTHHISRFTFYILLLWLILGTLHIFPYELTFFNEFIGGPANGWRYLTDTNTDWRHGWKALQAWQEALDQPLYCHSSGGYTTLEDYGIYCEEPPSPAIHDARLLYPELYFYPYPGEYAISVNSLRKDRYVWFLHHQPDHIIANTHFYYHVAPLDSPWLAQCTVPAAPLTSDAIEVGFAYFVPRELLFDCTQTWVYPDGGQTTGWYALHDQQLQPAGRQDRLSMHPSLPIDTFVARHLTRTPQTFRQWEYQSLPAFALYESEGEDASIQNPKSKIAYPARAEAVPVGLQESALAPILLDGPLTFLGTSSYRATGSDILEVETWWQVNENVPQRAFSLMAHLLTAEGTPLEVADGLGISPLLLQQGDILVQRHHFSNTASDTPLWLRTGVYWLDDGSRCPVRYDNADAIFIPLE
ncbi:MAG: glycosyltransferase family 39 protein [Anaerolineae bacterium]|nr:glycosyltransferase family 39 protein [Anaerolineae bacterium]